MLTLGCIPSTSLAESAAPLAVSAAKSLSLPSGSVTVLAALESASTADSAAADTAVARLPLECSSVRNSSSAFS